MAKPSTDSEEESGRTSGDAEWDHDAVLADKKFMQMLLRELKLFEVCVRIFEQECAETIISTQKEVQSQNIDAMLSEKHSDTTRNHHRQGANDSSSFAARS